MITQTQFEALGPIGREIIQVDRVLSAIRRSAVPDFRAFQAYRQDRRMLSAAAEIICRRPPGGSWGRSA